MKRTMTRVIFRKYRDGGNIVAIFPDLLGTNDPVTCLCYEHVGQHGSCDPSAIIGITTPSSEVDHESLSIELLRDVGYELLGLLKRIPANAYTKRLAVINTLVNNQGAILCQTPTHTKTTTTPDCTMRHSGNS